MVTTEDERILVKNVFAGGKFLIFQGVLRRILFFARLL